MNEDIGRMLRRWQFNPENAIRKIVDSEDREKIQVRVDQGAFQGILQMELEGRPDGKRPHKRAYAMDHFKSLLEEHILKHGTDNGFSLSKKVCEEIFDESLRIYERYIFLLQIQDYRRVIRDTERNMQVFHFVSRYAEREDDRKNHEKWWPYIIRINGVARVMIATKSKNFELALKLIEETRKRIEKLEPVQAEEFEVEKHRSLKALKELRPAVEKMRPLTLAQKLENDLKRAVEREEFERAAALRDRIKELNRG